MFKYRGQDVHLVKVGLVRAGCPREISTAIENTAINTAIVMTKNVKGLGRIEATNYTPEGVIVSGAYMRNRLLECGVAVSWAFVQAGAVKNMNADDAISSNELMEKLTQLLQERTFGALKTPISGSPWPYIVEVYPFENYFIYTYKGQKYRQFYALDPIERKAALRGGSVPVAEKFVNANDDRMPRVQTGVRYANAPIPGNRQSVHYGAAHSELVTQVIRSFANVVEAAAAYLAHGVRVTNGKVLPHGQMRPAYQPVALGVDGARGANGTFLTAKGIDHFSFAVWGARMLSEAQKQKLPIGKYLAKIKKVDAGGPGSGRHGSGANPEDRFTHADKAEALTEKATTSNSKKDFQDASDAHTKAAASWSAKAKTVSGPDKHYAEHVANYHTRAASFHALKAKEL